MSEESEMRWNPDREMGVDGEIIVIPAPPDSPEVQHNQVGVAFDIRLSSPELFEAVNIRIDGNGTVVFEVFFHNLTAINNRRKVGHTMAKVVV